MSEMAMSDDKLQGVFVPVVTPFEDDELAPGSLRENLKRLSETDVTGYLALGSNGEARSLNEEEECRVLEIFAEERADKIVMVGTGCESTRESIRKTERAAQMGFSYASVLTPSYFAGYMNDDTLIDFYRRIADSSPIPILVYNAPGFAGGVSLSVAGVTVLAEHGNIAGMKDSAPAGPGAYLAVLSAEIHFVVLAGSTNFFYPSLVMGAVGGVLSAANYLPKDCCRLYDLYRKKKYDQALDLHRRLVRINQAVSSRYGVAGVKAAMEILGYQGGEPRHPLRALDSSTKDSLRRILETGGVGD
jgi:4-hydroxy-2-oxoglutarate aldolase